MQDIITRLAAALKTARGHLDGYLDDFENHESGAAYGNDWSMNRLKSDIETIDQTLADSARLSGVRPFVDCSSAHLPQYIRCRLEDDSMEGVIVRNHEYGWWVHVPEPEDTSDKEVALIYAAIPHELQTLLDHARSLGCWWINFDQDAAALPGLPLYLDHGERVTLPGAEAPAAPGA